MKLKKLLLISLFSASACANGALQNDDSIMSESLKRQGMPANSYTANEESSIQEQEENTSPKMGEASIDKTDVQKMEEQVEILERKVETLETKLARSKERRQEQTDTPKEEAKTDKELTGLVFSKELSSSTDSGAIGKFHVQAGMAEAIASYEDSPVETRSVPALKVCAVMADANRLSVEDFAFMGMSRDMAMNTVVERMKRGEYSSSKEIAEVDGVGPEGFSEIEDKIIAIQSDRFSE